MIIVTGVDNTGKTSLVSHLSEKFSIPIAPRDLRLPPVDGEEWFEWCRKGLERKGNFLYDRFFMDELVYGPIMRDGYVCSVQQMAALSSMMLIRQPMLILAWLPHEENLKSFNDRGQYPKPEHVKLLSDQFDKVFNSWPVTQLKNVRSFCYLTDGDYYRIDKEVKKYIDGGNIYGKCEGLQM